MALHAPAMLVHMRGWGCWVGEAEPARRWGNFEFYVPLEELPRHVHLCEGFFRSARFKYLCISAFVLTSLTKLKNLYHLKHRIHKMWFNFHFTEVKTFNFLRLSRKLAEKMQKKFLRLWRGFLCAKWQARKKESLLHRSESVELTSQDIFSFLSQILIRFQVKFVPAVFDTKWNRKRNCN